MDKKGPRKIVVVGQNGPPRVRTIPDRTDVPRPPATPRPRPVLASPRGAPVHEPNACHNCAAFGQMRQYQTIGGHEVLLCEGCAKQAREESFGPQDPLDFAIRVGGFESNRSKH